jgi:hypothetical protein
VACSYKGTCLEKIHGINAWIFEVFLQGVFLRVISINQEHDPARKLPISTSNKNKKYINGVFKPALYYSEIMRNPRYCCKKKSRIPGSFSLQ